jgi:hypothetical protein
VKASSPRFPSSRQPPQQEPASRDVFQQQAEPSRLELSTA